MLCDFFKPRARLEAEILILRHQLNVLQQRTPRRRLHLRWIDRALCVLLSRHRVACWIFGRDGISRQLRRYAPRGDRSLGISHDPEFEGWHANMNLMQALARHGRIYRVPARTALDRAS
jgi:hypothetical protein